MIEEGPKQQKGTENVRDYGNLSLSLSASGISLTCDGWYKRYQYRQALS